VGLRAAKGGWMASGQKKNTLTSCGLASRCSRHKRQIEFYAQAEVAILRTLGIVSCLSQACHWRSDVTSVIQSVMCAVLPGVRD
jgi:hypothetical protein